MPTYSYRCPACGREYDRLQKMSDPTLVECPDCGAPGERQISAGIGFVFKGSGFYETDYKRAGKTRTKDESDKGDSEQPSTTTAKDSKADKKEKKDKPKTGEKS